MNITVKANNKVNLIKKIKLVLVDIKEKNDNYRKNGVVFAKRLDHWQVNLKNDPSALMGVQMMKHSGAYYYDVIYTKIKGNVVAFHRIFSIKRHYDLYCRMPVIGVFFIICVVVEQKRRFVLETDCFFHSVKYFDQFLLYLFCIFRDLTII